MPCGLNGQTYESTSTLGTNSRRVAPRHLFAQANSMAFPLCRSAQGDSTGAASGAAARLSEVPTGTRNQLNELVGRAWMQVILCRIRILGVRNGNAVISAA